MGLWTGIKYALNSTLGTKEFKTLDEIIRNNKILMASDDVYATLATAYNKAIYTNTSNPTVDVLTKSIKMENDGSLKISLYATYEAISDYPRAPLVFEVFKNDTSIYTETDTGGSGKIFKTDEIIFTRGDVIKVKVWVDGSSYAQQGTAATYIGNDIEILGTFKENVFSYI